MENCDHCHQELSRENQSSDRPRQLCEPCLSLEEGNPSVSMSPLMQDDLELTLAWRSNPLIFEQFRRQDEPLDWHEHLKWYENRDSLRYDFLLHYDGRRVGSVNITETDTVGIYLGDFAARKRGVATASLSWLCQRFYHRTPLSAEIHEANDASKRLVERCNFVRQGWDGEWLQYSYDS